MALWICTGCTATYSVGAARCPQCQSTDYLEADAMPKITLHGGPSNAADEPEPNDTPEEESSPGSSSETSSRKPEPSTKPSGSAARSRARTTASPSDPGPMAPSTAPGTVGDLTAPTSDAGE